MGKKRFLLFIPFLFFSNHISPMDSHIEIDPEKKAEVYLHRNEETKKNRINLDISCGGTCSWKENKIFEKLLEYLRSLKNIVYLNCVDATTEEVSTTINECHTNNLTVLSLDSANLQLDKIPFSKLPKLQYISLAKIEIPKNFFKKLGSSFPKIASITLEHVNTEKQPLREDSFENFKNLGCIDLRGNSSSNLLNLMGKSECPIHRIELYCEDHTETNFKLLRKVEQAYLYFDDYESLYSVVNNIFESSSLLYHLQLCKGKKPSWHYHDSGLTYRDKKNGIKAENIAWEKAPNLTSADIIYVELNEEEIAQILEKCPIKRLSFLWIFPEGTDARKYSNKQTFIEGRYLWEHELKALKTVKEAIKKQFPDEFKNIEVEAEGQNRIDITYRNRPKK